MFLKHRRAGKKGSRLYMGRREPQREDAVQTVAICDHELKVVARRLHKIAFADCLRFIQQQLRVVDDAISFREYSTQGFV